MPRNSNAVEETVETGMLELSAGIGRAVTASGTCGVDSGDNLTWTLKDGVLTISGMGEMADATSNMPWASYMDQIVNIVIENGVTNIGKVAFRDCSNLSSVTIPDSVTSIGVYAFYNCSSLSDVMIPDSVTSIGGDAFNGCSNLNSVTIPDSVTSIGGGAFRDCSSLISVTIPSSITRISWSVFSGCSNLSSVTIPGSVTSIGNRAFLHCQALSDVYYEKSESDWNNIAIEEGNESLSKAMIHYNSDGPVPVMSSELDEGVLYVPYADTIEIFNFNEQNLPLFHITEGALPQGLELDSDTGKIFGAPLETGRFEFSVEAIYNGNIDTTLRGNQIITVKQNTDENVYECSDQGYELKHPIGDETLEGYILTEYKDQLFVSEGAYEEFIALWLNGEKLVEGEHYTKEPGSTRITIRSQTFRDKAKSGSNTIAAEFKTKNNELKRTTQKFILDVKQSGSDGNGNGTGDTGDGSNSGGNSGSDNSGSDSGGSSGNSSGTGSRRRSGGGSGSSANITLPSSDDSWIKDEVGWWYKKPDNTWLSGGWYLLSYKEEMGWYYFNEQGYMAVGWIEDKERKYYLNPVSDGT